MTTIKFYTDTKLLDEGISNIHLFPLLDCLIIDGVLQGNSDFQFVKSPEDCDMFLYPITIEYTLGLGKKSKLIEFIKNGQRQNKKVLVFSTGDIGLTLKFSNLLILRLGGFKSKMGNETFIMPPFIEDPYIILNDKFSSIEKQDKPSIGFVGHANGGFVKLIKELLTFYKLNILRILKRKFVDYQPFYPSSYFRYKYLNLLEKNKLVNANFVYRNKYRAGAKTKKDLEETTLAFYQNINSNLYTFCMRGMGNFSVRFYETLAMGRIPVLIDTDCKLPFSKSIDWKKHCLILDKKDTIKLSASLIDFHNSLSLENLKLIQQSNRLLWENYFTKYNFFRALKDELLKELK